MAAFMLSRNLLQGVDLAPTVAAAASPALNGDLRAAPPVSHGAWRLGRNRCGALSFVSPAQGLGFGLERMRRSGSEKHGVVTMVAVPVRPVNLPTEHEKREAGNLGEAESEEEREFDPSALPPFTLAEIRAAIPKHCWEKNPWKSMSFVARDVAIVFGLAAGAAYLNTWFVWPLYWLAQGTMFWALFVLGHDCGHGSFSNNKKLNSLVGHLTHSSILVPYHGCLQRLLTTLSTWPPTIRPQNYIFAFTMSQIFLNQCDVLLVIPLQQRRISHRTHHQNHGHVENDESWHPISETIYKDMDFWAKKGRLSFPWAMLAYPFYLWSRSPGKRGSHFHPESDLFVPNEAKDVMTSTACWTAMLATLVALTFVVGPMWMLKLYVMPYLVNVVWLDVVTYLHHHGYDKKVPWYRGTEWNYMRGGLSTIDRDYGWFNNIHHDIGTHVVHHLFPQIPHYNLIEATEAIKPILGQYYRDPRKSGPIPTHLIEPLLTSLKQDHYVPDSGDIVFYQTDPQISP